MPETDLTQTLTAINDQLGRMSSGFAEFTSKLAAERGEIAGKIEAIHADLGGLRDAMNGLQAKMSSIATDLERFDSALRGEPDGKQPGILLRLDRLEQDRERKIWHVRALAGAVIAALAKLVVDYIKFGR